MPKRTNETTSPNRFGRVLKKFRTAKELGLRELAEDVQLSAGYLSRLESGAVKSPPSEAAIERLAKRLEVSPDDLICAAGRVPDDVVAFITKHPEVLPQIREMKATARRS